MTLKLHTDLSLLPLAHPVQLLIPFIGMMDYEHHHILSGRFNEYESKGKEFIQLVDIENCDACLLPITYQVVGDTINFQKAIQPFIKEVEKSGKPILIFEGHDHTRFTVDIKNAIIFNSASGRSLQPKNVFAWPHFFEDFVEKYCNGETVPKNKSTTPIIGFCGYAPPLNIKFGRDKVVGYIKLLANFLGIMRKYPDKTSHSSRTRALIGLHKSKKIICNFRLKSNFAFGPQGALNTGKTTESDAEFRSNFVNNILESDYTLCVRGIGNNSVRFFETLCCGRIPVFVNTDSALPFDHVIDWKQFCVWVEEKDIDKVGDIVADFHKNTSDADFIALQKKCRTVWEEYLSPVGFYKNLHLFLNK